MHTKKKNNTTNFEDYGEQFNVNKRIWAWPVMFGVACPGAIVTNSK